MGITLSERGLASLGALLFTLALTKDAHVDHGDNKQTAPTPIMIEHERAMETHFALYSVKGQEPPKEPNYFSVDPYPSLSRDGMPPLAATRPIDFLTLSGNLYRISHSKRENKTVDPNDQDGSNVIFDHCKFHTVTSDLTVSKGMYVNPKYIDEVQLAPGWPPRDLIFDSYPNEC